MKKHFSLFSGILIVASLFAVHSKAHVSNSSIACVCYAGNKTKRIYIPPPDEFFKKAGSKNGASITIIYSGFTSQAKTALEYAVSILETILPADAKFTITASWERISTKGVLASASVNDYEEGWKIDALNPKTLYPVALAEKISGKSLNEDLDGDIILTINSSMNWYFGTDGNTSDTKYDLVTVVLHEICHGLGFFDSMNTDNSIGWYGRDSIPIIYDTFVEDIQGNSLTNPLKYRNYSANLLAAFTGNQLYFDGPLLGVFTSESRARLYAPSVFKPGSSISHLDEASTLQVDALMTPFIDKGEAIHDPGKLTMSILGDLGWINTRIIHEALPDTEDDLKEVLLSIRVVSDTLFNRDLVGAVFSFDNFATSDTLFMASPNLNDIFSCKISIPSYNKELQYYFFVEDSFMRVYRSPSLIDSLHKAFIGTDTVKPVISHVPVTSYLEKIDTIKFDAKATDNIGIDTVYLEYKLNNDQPVFVGLNPEASDIYSAFLTSGSFNLNGGDSIQYRFIATDTAMVPNSAVLPDTGYFVIHIEAIYSTLESYSADFSGEAADDFLNVGFDISQPADFTGYGLHTKHPYESPEDNDKSIEYTALLRHPLKFNESGLVIDFNEIVLVEPGEPGSVFGSMDFYDYVILEGSKNFGKTWFSLSDGYDSRILESWETEYNNSIVGQNSTAVGNESMLRKHTLRFAPSGDISAGDTLLVRFRLYSDPYANGWGWVIEDLKIGPLVDAVDNISTDVINKIYPNPGTGLFKISSSISGSGYGKPVWYNIFNSSGICIMSDYFSSGTETDIDISDYPAGIYIIVLYRDNWRNTITYSLIK